MSLWRKRLSIKSDDLSIKSEKAMREVQRLGQEIEQEPVAWQWLTTAHFRKKLPKDAEKGAWNPLYTTPQQRTWVGLAEKEILKFQDIVPNTLSYDLIEFAKAIEAKLKEKNT
jgi:hypothetical protein